ncbi:MAG: SAM-dependent methyltransferase [Prevotella sp.]|nr:SAM-dependent methyltransferase [Prevotella sp.]
MRTSDFIDSHANDDIRALALKHAGRKDIDLPFALDQIAGRRTARRKLPTWAETEGITYPPHISMEQCSSEQTARYKAAIAERMAGGGLMVDITGGLGVDFSFMARCFDSAVYVERQEHLCAIAERNFARLGLGNSRIVCGDGVEYLQTMKEHAALIFVDPARRNDNGGRTYAIGDCTPDILGIKDLLLDKADSIIIKLSPMLDWHKAAADIGRNVCEVHIVSVENECKELLVILSKDAEKPLTVFCTDGDNVISYRPETENKTPECRHDETIRPAATNDTAPVGSESDTPHTPKYLYEPNASIMKAGCFDLVGRMFGMRQISNDSHLFVSNEPADNFPGREFVISTITGMNKKDIRKTLAGITQANIATRNFPLPVAELRRKLRLKDGGDTFIFATTTADKKHILIVCKRKTA